jgi:hypothetical protein
MHFCEMELQGMAVEPCGQPATAKHGGCWYCEYHFDALEQAEARWAIESGDECYSPEGEEG